MNNKSNLFDEDFADDPALSDLDQTDQTMPLNQDKQTFNRRRLEDRLERKKLEADIGWHNDDDIFSYD